MNRRTVYKGSSKSGGLSEIYKVTMVKIVYCTALYGDSEVAIGPANTFHGRTPYGVVSV